MILRVKDGQDGHRHGLKIKHGLRADRPRGYEPKVLPRRRGGYPAARGASKQASAHQEGFGDLFDGGRFFAHRDSKG
jgi:hypothetical protein